MHNQESVRHPSRITMTTTAIPVRLIFVDIILNRVCINNQYIFSLSILLDCLWLATFIPVIIFMVSGPFRGSTLSMYCKRNLFEPDTWNLHFISTFMIGTHCSLSDPLRSVPEDSIVES